MTAKQELLEEIVHLKKTISKCRSNIKNNIKKYITLAEQSFDAIAIFKSDNLNLIFANEKLSKLTEFSNKELFASKKNILFDIIENKEHKNILLAEYKRCLSKKFSDTTQEIKIITKSNKLKWLEMHCNPIISNNEIYVLMNYRDITEKKLYIKKLIHKEKLASLGQMSASISHEFKNILSVIQLEIQMLNWENSKDSVTNDSYFRILDQVKNASFLIDSIKNFSKLQNKKKELCIISNCINDIIKIYNPILKKKNIQIQTEFKNQSVVKLNKSEFQQILFNLFNNAVDALKNIEKPSINITLTKSDEFCIIKFKDNGSGIKKKNRNLIFEEFFTTKHNENGTGLGLAIIKTILKSYGGDIFLSNKTECTEFVIKFPVI